MIDKLARVRLAHLPTPLEEAPRFSAAVGNKVRILIKRDDCTGLALGGNKARHNEFLMGDALQQGCDLVIWGAKVQSNNCRQTAAACAKLGLECHLHLSRKGQSTEPQGNLLLDHLVGAKVHFTDAEIGPELDAHLEQQAEIARQQGRRPYVWHRPRVLPLAAASYVLCLDEIREQHPGPIDAIYVCSAGSTGIGVVLGNQRLKLATTVRLISPMHWPWKIADDMARHANQLAEWIGSPVRMTPSDFPVDESFVAPGYGKPSKAGQEAMALLAGTEGILTDHVYSAKALAALIHDVRSGVIPAGGTVVFIHTGGVPAIFAEPRAVCPSVALPQS